MVDVTESLDELLQLRRPRDFLLDKPPSQYITSAADMLSKITKMEGILKSSFIDYVGYNRHIKVFGEKVMKPQEKSSLDQSLSLFIATCASNIHDLVPPKAGTDSSKDHYKEVKSFILNVNNCSHSLVFYKVY